MIITAQTKAETERLRSIDRQCRRLAKEASSLYHRSVQARMPLETLSAVAKLAADIAAIHNRCTIGITKEAADDKENRPN
jgi:hypothetical protein